MRMAHSNISVPSSTFLRSETALAATDIRKKRLSRPTQQKNTALGERTVLFGFSTNYLKIFPMS